MDATNVLIEKETGGEAVPAYLALEGLLPGVLPLMAFPLLLQLELLPAVAALELGLQVGAHVPLEIVLFPATKLAVLALKLLLVDLLPVHGKVGLGVLPLILLATYLTAPDGSLRIGTPHLLFSLCVALFQVLLIVFPQEVLSAELTQSCSFSLLQGAPLEAIV